MPYIIETRMAAEPPNQNVAVRAAVLSRTAVATLEEAADQIERIADAWLNSVPEDDYTVETHRQYRRIIEAWHAWDESGGTVGPLPDGTVIEVRDIPLLDLTAQLHDGHRYRMTIAEAVEAFNAA